MDKALIRQKAEAMVDKTDESDDLLDKQDAREIIHELRVHQIELELQNEELRQTQEQLTAARKEYFELYNFAPAAYLTLDEHGVIKNINLTGATMLNRERRFLMNRPLLPLIHASSQTEFFKFLGDVFKSQTARQTELMLMSNDLWVKVDAMAATSTEGELICRLVMTDVTHLHQAEKALELEKKRLAITLRAIAEGVIVTNETGLITMINQPALTMLGQSSAQLEQKRLSDVFKIYDETSNAYLTPSLLALVNKDEPQVTQTVLLRVEDGQEFVIELSAAPIKDGQTKLGIIVVFHDETEKRERLAQQLRTQRLESLGVLGGGIAHDFNNLLTGLFGNIEMAKTLLAEGHEASTYLEAAMRPMDNAINLTQQLLTFAKGGNPIKRVLQVGPIVLEAAEFALHGSNVKLESHIDPDLYLVEADRGQLTQVISNLVINAQQAMPFGGTVKIAAENIEKSTGRYVQIRVEDEGTGIAPQNLEKIFDPYFTTKEEGSGLGLATVYSIINKHHGTISVKSELGKRTIFTMHLLAIDKPLETAQPKQVDPIEAQSIPASYVLVLDDDELVRDILGMMLKQLGCEVVFAEEGREAILKYQEAYLSGKPFDFALFDLTIPGGMGGHEATQEILIIDPQAKVIVSSGYATDPIMADYQAYGFRARLSKPYSFAELRKKVQEVQQPALE